MVLTDGYREESYIRNFTWKQRVRPQHTHHQDYTFKQSAQVQHSQHGKYSSNYKMYDYPGRFKDWETAKQFTTYQQESHVRDEAVGYAQTDIIYPSAGHVFDLADHRNPAFNQRYLIISVHHQGRQPSVLEEEAGLVHVEDLGNDHSLITSYHNQMEFCIKERVFWRPPRRIRPVVDGPQIAKVVGPSGEEIYTDEFGHVKVQFPRDRYGESNEYSSCWIRVSQNWAGGSWGHMAIPRINQEVIVEFLEGDPDQPIIIGRTYHSSNRPPYRLADHKTRMTIKSKTHKGDGFNELRFEDEKGREEIFIKAEKDHNTYVQNNKTELVLNSNIRQVEIDDLTRIGMNAVQTVGMQKKINVGHSYVLNTGSFETHDEHKLYWEQWQNMLIRPYLMLQGSQGFSSTPTGNLPSTKGLQIFDSSSATQGSYNLNVETVAQINVKYNSEEYIGKTKVIVAGESVDLSSGKMSTSTSEKINIIGHKEIVISSGPTYIKLLSSGEVVIDANKLILSADNITAYASDKYEIEATDVEIKGSSTIKLKGGKIDLN